MGEKEQPEYKISKTEVIKGASGMVFEEHSLTVVGKDLKQVEKVFDKKWKNNN